MRYYMLASGSTGNCTALVNDNEEIVLIDCGIAIKDIQNKLNCLGLSYDNIKYLIITHTHTDHIKSIRAFDEKIVYNFHCYEPFPFTHQGAYWVEQMPSDFRIDYPADMDTYKERSKVIDPDMGGAIFKVKVDKLGPDFFETIFKPALEKSKQDDIPLYCGEYGVIDLADNHGKIRWLKDIHTVFEKYGIGNALWNYKEKDFGLVNEQFADIKDEFIAMMKG